jgi:hypothetical protein
MPDKDRAQRRWSHFTQDDVQRMAKATPPEEYRHGEWGEGPYMPAFSGDLVGRRFEIDFTDGLRAVYEFTGVNELKWSFGGDEHTDICDVHTITPNLYFVNHYVVDSKPPEAHQVVIDLDNGLVTLNVATMNHPIEPRDVMRTFHFGFITNCGYEDPGYRHDFTTDMVGRAIYWTYHERGPKIKHMYITPFFYTVSGVRSPDWAASNPADYVKIRDGVYVFSFLEWRQSGAQGFFLMDFYQMHDVGCFFGMEPEGIVCYTIGAKGEWADYLYTLPGDAPRATGFGWEKKD